MGPKARPKPRAKRAAGTGPLPSAGILGGGQLARMLLEAAETLGLRPRVLTESLRSPAAKISTETVIGGFDEEPAVRTLLAKSDVAVFENEFVPAPVLAAAAKGTKAVFRPGLDVIARLQDKAGQKETLSKLGIPTAPADVYESGPLEAWIKKQWATFPKGCVFKWAQQGYDGKGVFLARGPKDAAKAEAFCKLALARRVRVLCEERVPFKRELALVACYSITGEFAAYPVVVSEQKDGICWRVYGPASALGLPPEKERLAQQYAWKLAVGARLHGAFALELFETAKGELWVNEIAPRVHNSGHYTQDAAATSQFENHWRAVLGLPLGKTTAAPAFAMQNLLGPEGLKFSASEFSPPPAPAPLRAHWYGKEEIEPRRKLGHVNASTEDAAGLKDLLKKLDLYEKEWAESLRRLKRKKS